MAEETVPRVSRVSLSVKNHNPTDTRPRSTITLTFSMDDVLQINDDTPQDAQCAESFLVMQIPIATGKGRIVRMHFNPEASTLEIVVLTSFLKGATDTITNYCQNLGISVA